MPSSFETGSVSQLFATPIWSFKPRGAAALVDSVAARLRILRDADPRWISRGRAGFWQSSDELAKDPAFGPLVALVDEAALAVLKLLEVDCKLRITGLWGNIGDRAHALHEHTHPNNYLSGIFYVQTPPASGTTRFKDPRPQVRVLRPRVVRDNPLNSLEFHYAGSPGTLLFFPAWLEHSVEPGTAEGERITVAFNLMVTGPLGDHAQLAYSEI